MVEGTELTPRSLPLTSTCALRHDLSPKNVIYKFLELLNEFSKDMGRINGSKPSHEHNEQSETKTKISIEFAVSNSPHLEQHLDINPIKHIYVC